MKEPIFRISIIINYGILLFRIETAGSDEEVNPVDAKEGEASSAGEGNGNQ